ncbi:hypothetical protein HDU76_000036 [Blyttiomyces sp. JEL0837]|nr:hypothetical protein HDU76_000036 [Blyttiomyces sp. JEL0837]
MSDDEELENDLFGGNISDDEEIEEERPSSQDKDDDGESDDRDRREDQRRRSDDEDDRLDSDNEREQRERNEERYQSDDRERARIEKSLELPYLTRPTTDQLYLAKLPSFLAIESRPFDADTFEKEFEEAIESGEGKEELEYRALKAANTLRWRYKNATSNEKDSNARLVCWSDNSYSLLLGTEMFDCAIKPAGDHHYLVVLHDKEAVMETQAHFTQKLMFAPASMQSATHRRLTAAIANKNKKDARTKLFAKMQDPEQEKREAEKMEREARKAEKKLRDDRRKLASSYSGRRSDLDSDDDDLRPRQSNRDRYDDYEDDFVEYDQGDGDESDEEEREREARLKSSKKASDSRKRIYEDDEDDDLDDRPEPEVAGSASKPAKRSRLVIESDEESS